MTQVLINTKVVEQLVAALNEVDQHVDLKRYDTAPNEVLFDVVVAALTVGREVLAKAEPTGWQKIETAPKDRTMFVVRGFNVAVRKDYHYDTDPYCVLATGDGFKRWPHPFKPTHWMPLPAAPKEQQ